MVNFMSLFNKEELLRESREAIDSILDTEYLEGEFPILMTPQVADRALKLVERFIYNGCPRPRINPTSGETRVINTIDLYWDLEDKTLLINVEEGNEYPVFYLAYKNADMSLSGKTLVPNQVNTLSMLLLNEQC